MGLAVQHKRAVSRGHCWCSSCAGCWGWLAGFSSLAKHLTLKDILILYERAHLATGQVQAPLCTYAQAGEGDTNWVPDALPVEVRIAICGTVADEMACLVAPEAHITGRRYLVATPASAASSASSTPSGKLLLP